MQLVIGLPFLLLLLLGVEGKPTFDRIAEVLLDELTDGPHYDQSYRQPVHHHPHSYPVHPPHPGGPLIQEGYDHGYDYYYGGGSSHGYGGGIVAQPGPYVQPAPYVQPPPYAQPPPHGYYQSPTKGYYAQPQSSYNRPPPSTNGYSQGYAGHAAVGGYKQHGY
ncbi:metacaspase-5 [Drosophila nasuta]|uniref:metacaspase-5 n=1 Tax=Drosophila nasuta TaxID=42062 RepID=UPI00295F456F|nr:metacaspase-5 [Drosophila nasuta]